MKVLVVDDEPGILEVIRACLSADGWEVSCATDSKAAYMLALAEPPGLLIADLLLKEQSGKLLAERIRALPGLGDLPIIFISATYTVNRLDLNKKTMMLPKPFDLVELQAAALKMTGQSGPAGD
jgi:DNA-binding response OmpR family regulator